MLTEPQILRFSRPVLLREVGGAGQLAFLAACVRIPRLDEGGRATALWLARAGIGALALPQDVSTCPAQDASGLLHRDDVGRPLVEMARKRLIEHWPELRFASEATVEARVATNATDGALAALEVLRGLLAQGTDASHAGIQPRMKLS